MKPQIIVTPVLKHWKFSQHPFKDSTLKEKSEMDLFINREQEIRRLHNSLSSKLSGVYGVQGIGKSSILHRLRHIVEKEKVVTALVEMMGTSEKLLYTSILKVLLLKIADRSIKLKKSTLNVKEELIRVERTVTYVSSIESSGETGAFFIKGKVGAKKGSEELLEKHTDDTSIEIIRNILLCLEEPLVIVIDNLERTGALVDNADVYFRFVNRFAATVDSSFHSKGKNAAFVVTLDRSFVSRITSEYQTGEGVVSFSFGNLIEIRNFVPQHLRDIIKRRLELVGWDKSIWEFITKDAFWSLFIVSEGHPRRAFALIREAMELIADYKAVLQIDADVVREAAVNCNQSVDEANLKILKVLSDDKGYSPSDIALKNAVGITRSNIRKRIIELLAKGALVVKQEKSGKAVKDVYYLADL